MTRALDGSYWRVKLTSMKASQSGYLIQGPDVKPTRFDTIEQAENAMQRRAGTADFVYRIVRIRPRMSIVKAVRLLTEARKQGVELWMRCDRSLWHRQDDVCRNWYSLFDGPDVLERWIVATPSDARKIDARRGSG